ncbi:hypothetical protein [Algoriphagus persicinus]|uniref:hypothetical protein n=1 Tax=Algoriphagus persicinus TaxID=3108754 RepID=UPI002B3E911F|nr:hypothetical protein [Algoriphagus sp. E1-3-M2]MEB2784849.1 hypothetical protein [Algoriphagus sp. E1-3-M2]
MNIQYIKNDKGEDAGVFIPIEEWEGLLERLKKMEGEDSPAQDWHISVVNERMEDYHKKSSETFDTEESLREIEDDL